MNDFNLIPTNKENIPFFEWKQYQTQKYNGEFPKGCNYSLVCGYENIICLDFDSQLNHDSVLPYKYVDDVLSGLKTRIDRSPHGYHVLVIADKLPKLSSWTNGVSRIEIKSLGSLCTMPPSVKNGFEYYNLNKNPHPNRVNMYEVLERIQKLGYTGKVNGEQRTFQFDKKLSTGERNDSLFRLCCSMKNKLNEHEIEIFADYVNQFWTEKALDKEELGNIVKSALKYKGKNEHPRSEQTWQ